MVRRVSQHLIASLKISKWFGCLFTEECGQPRMQYIPHGFIFLHYAVLGGKLQQLRWLHGNTKQMQLAHISTLQQSHRIAFGAAMYVVRPISLVIALFGTLRLAFFQWPQAEYSRGATTRPYVCEGLCYQS